VGVRAWGGPDGDRHPFPITTHPLQAFVTEPLKPFLDKVIVSANLHVYVSQTDRGECVIGSEIDPYAPTAIAPPFPSWKTRPIIPWSSSPV
jgi:glycine/D-amino acid oxidase-like deaminating enzyme